MDFEEWEILPDDEILDYQTEKKKVAGGRRNSALKSVLNMDYFKVESPEANPSTAKSRPLPPTQLVPVPFQLEPKTWKPLEKDGDQPADQIITKVPIDVTVVGSAIPEKIGPAALDPEGKSRVFFKKTSNNESVDISVTSPRSSTNGYVPQFDAGVFNFEEKNETSLEICKTTSPRKRDLLNKQSDLEDEKEETWEEENNGGLNLWKWSLTGIGAICSFGVAAATVCIVVFGTQQRDKHQKQNQKLRFQIYAGDKRIKQVVHHATKLNEAISAARGVPFNIAHISFGGSNEGL